MSSTRCTSEHSAHYIQHQTLFSTVVLICDIRLGILLASELGITTSNDERQLMVIPLLGIAVNWVTLRLFRNHSFLIVDSWLFSCSDLIVTYIIITALPASFSGGLHLSLAYILASSVLIGLVNQTLWTSVWSAGIILSLALLKFHHAELSTVVTAAMVVAIFASTLLGNRLHRQFTEIGRLYTEVASARAEERALAERLTIARDLHDSLAKSVHGIRMLAETLESSLGAENHPDAPLSHTLFESADEASREARLVLDGLRSGGDKDVIGALIEEATSWGARTGLSVSVDRANSNTPLPCSTEAMWQLQRILGEVLTNIEKHAHATSVDLSMFHDDNCFNLDIRDDGIGLSNGFKDIHRDGHYGLAGLKERSEILNGVFTIDSFSDLTPGTRVRLRVPITSLHTTTNREKST